MLVKRIHFKNSPWPYVLIAPQVIITLIFFIWPALAALKQAFYRGDAFGLHSHFVWFENFKELLHDPSYLNAFLMSMLFSFLVVMFALIPALFIAVLVSNVVRGRNAYRTLFIWPYAVAPAVAGMLWRFLFNPAVGVVPHWLHQIGYDWNYTIHWGQALFLVSLTAAWQQFSYNFIFFLAGIMAIPNAVFEAAALDGAHAIRRFRDIILPLLSPITFFLIIVNVIYAFFSTFGIIQVITQGGPSDATDILIYKVYNDGFLGLDLGGSSAQSVVLMIIVILLTVIQFRYIEKKVHY